MLLTASLQLQEPLTQCQALGKRGLKDQPEANPRAAEAFCSVPMNAPHPHPQNETCVAGVPSAGWRHNKAPISTYETSSTIKGANVSHRTRFLKKPSLTNITSMQVNS